MADLSAGNEGSSGSVDTGSNTSAGGNGAAGSSNAVAEPSVFDVDDNALIRVKGSDKPVKFGDHVRGFQSQFTKASQEAARLKKELADERSRREQIERSRQAPPQNGQPQTDVYAALEQLPYLDGKQAADVVRSIAGQIGQRDQVLLATLKQLQQLKGIVDGLHQTHTSQSFESKIGKWLQDGGYDTGYADLAKEIYLAYEGDDLDAEFPQIFKSRVDQMEKLFDAKRAAKVSGARRTPFVPGKGAVVGPSKPLEVKANASAKEIADMFWNQGWDETET